MGEISEMVLDGVLCEGCGVYLGEGDGYPGRCSACADGADELSVQLLKCKHCNRQFATDTARRQHANAKHKGAP